MAAGTSLSSLNRQKEQTVNAMDNMRAEITNLEDEIERLREASESLEDSIESLESIESDVDELEVSKGRWKGEEVETFTEKQSDFASSIEKYTSETERVNSHLKKLITKAQLKKAGLQTALGVQSLALGGIMTEVSNQKEEG